MVRVADAPDPQRINELAVYWAPMQGVITDSLVEVLGLVFYGTIAAVLTVLGALAELASLQDLTAGPSLFGLWEVAVGTLLLYAAYNVLSEFVVPSLRGERDSTA